MMKKTLLYISAAALAMTAALTSCDDNFVHPPVIMPPTEYLEPNTTLADIKTQYWSSVTDQSPVTLGSAEDGGDLIFTGRVCSSDADGNFYKSIVVQAVDADGVQTAINFSVNDKEIYKILPYGQEVAVYATGLSVGGYKNLMQFGAIDGNEMTFMDLTEFTTHVVRNNSNLPEPEKVVSTETTIPELIKAKGSSSELMKWQSRMVTLKKVRWAEAGFPYAGGGNVTRYLVDEEGNIMPVRNSGSSTFKNDILPGGTGTVSGVLSYYSTDWQMVIVNTEAVQDFEPMEAFPGVAPEGTGTAADPYNVTAAYAAAQNKPAGQYYVKGKVLLVTEFSESYGNASYNIVDENGDVILYVYRGKGVGGAKFTAATCPKPGDEVTIKGELTVFSGNPQINQGSELVGGDTPTPPVGDETPSGSGTEADPYNAVAAIQAANAGSTDEVYVKGVITNIDELSTQYGNATYSIADAMGGTALKVYRGYWLNGDKFTSADQLAVGAQVVVKGKLTVYGGDAQVGTGSRIISYDGEGGGDTPTPPVGSDITYTKAASITSGAKYAMVVDGQYGARIEPQSYSYGRLTLTDANIAGDKLTAPATAAITITEVAGKGYTMVDSFGRYMAMDSDPAHRTSFQLYTAVTDGCYWSITFDGDKAVITNKLATDCTVCVSKGVEGTYYTNIAPAAGATDPKLPVLYKAD